MLVQRTLSIYFTSAFFGCTETFPSMRLMWWKQLLNPSSALSLSSQDWSAVACQSHCNIHDLITQGEVSVRNCNVWFNLLSGAIKGRRVNLSGNRLSTLGSAPQFPSLCPGGCEERERYSILHTHAHTHMHAIHTQGIADTQHLLLFSGEIKMKWPLITCDSSCQSVRYSHNWTSSLIWHWSLVLSYFQFWAALTLKVNVTLFLLGNILV